VPVAIPVRPAIWDAVWGPALSDSRILALFCPRGAGAALLLVAAAGFALVDAADLGLDARLLGAAARALREVVRGVRVAVRGVRVARAGEVRRLVAGERVLAGRAVSLAAAAPRVAVGSRPSISSASARNSLTALRPARSALLLAPSPISLRVFATCLRTPTRRRRSNRSLSFLAIVSPRKLLRKIVARHPTLPGHVWLVDIALAGGVSRTNSC